MRYTLEWIVAALQYVLGFYGFWLVWRVLLPHLPGPADRDERAAPFVWYFTDPFVVPIAHALHIPASLVALLCLLLVAGASVALGRVPGLV